MTEVTAKQHHGYWININMRCIEMGILLQVLFSIMMININMRCIEMQAGTRAILDYL